MLKFFLSFCDILHFANWQTQRSGLNTALQWKSLALLGLIAFVTFLPGRMSVPPFDRDEPRYMQATAQMLETHHFIDIRFQDKPRYVQPAGIYWLEAICATLAGQRYWHSVWPYRIPSLMAMTISVMLTACIGSMLFGQTAGILAGLLLLSSVLVTAESRMATIDSCLLVCVLLAQFALVRALQDRRLKQPTPIGTAVLYWVSIGCGLMLKGPVILMPSLATPLTLALIEKNASLWYRMRPRWGWIIAVVILLPWLVAIGFVSHGDFFYRSIGKNFLGKISSGQESHGLWPGYYLLIFLITFWPGSYFTMRVLPVIWCQKHDLNVRYLLCWIVPHWLVFETIPTKLPHYVLPVYPAIAILTAGMLIQRKTYWKKEIMTRLWRFFLGVYRIAWCLVGCLLACAAPFLLWKLENRISFFAFLFAAAVLYLVGLATVYLWQEKLRYALLSSLGAAIFLYTGLFIFVVPHLQTIWLAPRLVTLIQNNLVQDKKLCPHTDVFSVSFSEPSLVFLLRGDVHLTSAEQAADAIQKNPRCTIALVGRREQSDFFNALQHWHGKVISRGHVRGLNYSNGRFLNISLYTADIAPYIKETLYH
ncbi:MAG: glycosyltransferase family 39 protein [Acetobacter sp.]|nr:glycosyltransferase family 39 protein [Acetobacter sp.]MBQ5478643.1 glycosyltransferase family 39 protein [Acetobacter sp.]